MGWLAAIDALSRWHQFQNDFFDWNKDHGHGAVTFVLSEAQRQARAGESLQRWMLTKGVAWGRAYQQQLTAALRQAVVPLHSPAFSAYVEVRAEMVERRFGALEQGFTHLLALQAAAEA